MLQFREMFNNEYLFNEAHWEALAYRCFIQFNVCRCTPLYTRRTLPTTVSCFIMTRECVCTCFFLKLGGRMLFSRTPAALAMPTIFGQFLRRCVRFHVACTIPSHLTWCSLHGSC